ncbi:hypothetical protein LZ554_007439 [Drepanopeziza brunnea f. sp. 'monogermtubi']|nr:hypothetical protein LZ554_007439 [Drepanopeziza brunnea f. sp. 'monogermtubi']
MGCNLSEALTQAVISEILGILTAASRRSWWSSSSLKNLGVVFLRRSNAMIRIDPLAPLPLSPQLHRASFGRATSFTMVKHHTRLAEVIEGDQKVGPYSFEDLAELG